MFFFRNWRCKAECVCLVWENIQTKAPFSATFAIRVWPSQEATRMYHLWQEILSSWHLTGTLCALPSYETLAEILVPLWYRRSFKLCLTWHTLKLPLGCTNYSFQVAWLTEFCTVAPNICRSSTWNLHHITFLVSGILKWLLDISRICVPLSY